MRHHSILVTLLLVSITFTAAIADDLDLRAQPAEALATAGKIESEAITRNTTADAKAEAAYRRRLDLAAAGDQIKFLGKKGRANPQLVACSRGLLVYDAENNYLNSDWVMISQFGEQQPLGATNGVFLDGDYAGCLWYPFDSTITKNVENGSVTRWKFQVSFVQKEHLRKKASGDWTCEKGFGPNIPETLLGEYGIGKDKWGSYLKVNVVAPTVPDKNPPAASAAPAATSTAAPATTAPALVPPPTAPCPPAKRHKAPATTI